MSEKEEEEPKENQEESAQQDELKGHEEMEKVINVSGMYNEWFLDYASYVILERAVPHIHDGLKPVQRRILHSLREMDDGRFHKVANVIGNTMKYHPHGDASIGDALVQLGQRELMLDMQGNWGNIFTGDRAAAPRYIEVRLSKFALDVAFNHKTTSWLASYDGRNKEPLTLPVKFPLLLTQGVEGIAVGLACKILPHNFNELIDGSIAVLKGKKTDILPDFPTGGMADFSNYNEGIRGGRIRVRAKVLQEDKKTLKITEIPFGTTTSSLIDSIIKANDKGKIKVKKIEDNTAEFVEILIHLAPNVSPDKTIDALYAFTDCETSISPNIAVIEDDKPRFVGVNELLKLSTERTLSLLKWELEIKKGELEEEWHFASLEKIFIENRIYRDIEECETWEEIITTIHKGLKPHTKHLIREVTDEDVARLTEIRIKRISKFDSLKADDKIAALEGEIDKVKHSLANLVEFAIDYFKELKKKYGKGRERKTEIKQFDNIDATKVAVANSKLYADFKEGFIGTGLKRGEGEFICDCSDIDDIIVFRSDGKMMVTKVAAKSFVGKDIIYVNVWKKGDKRTIYNMIYRDGKSGAAMMKRFAVNSITRDKEYDLTKGAAGSSVLYFTANPNGEAELVQINLRPKPKLKKLKFELDFAELMIKGRGASGNILTKHSIHKISLKEKGVSTLGARKIWFDDSIQRLNTEEQGQYLGAFRAEDLILSITQSGHYKLTGFDLSTRFEEDLIAIEKWVPGKPISAVYFDGEKEQYFIKRFLVEKTDKKVLFISEHENSVLELVTTDWKPMLELQFVKPKNKDVREPEQINIEEFIAIKGLKAQGNRLSPHNVKDISLLEPIPYEPPVQEENIAAEEVNEDLNDSSEDEPNSQVEEKAEKFEKVESLEEKVEEKSNGKENKRMTSKSDEEQDDEDEKNQMKLF